MKRVIALILSAVFLINCMPHFAEAKTEYKTDIIAAGWDNAAVVLPDGTLFVWGNNEYGSIGNYSNGDYKYDTIDNLTLTPNAALNDVKSVKIVSSSIYAIRQDNSLWAWGWNYHGKLGNGNEENQSAPVKIMDDVKYVAGGHGLHAMAIKNDDSLWAWGWNEFYQLGDGTNTDRLTPVKVMEHVKYASVGYGYSAVIKSDNSLWIWGDNSFGNLGTGDKKDREKPAKILEDVASVSLGQTDGYALKKDGTLWAWGYNQNGELGIGTKSSKLKPVKIMSNVVSISPMNLFHCMALKKDGTLWTWGVNNDGQLGNGTTTSKLKPIKVMSDVISFNNGINFSFALKKDNTLWAWGNNEYGELGTGDQKNRLKPTKIMDLDTYEEKGNYTKPSRYVDGYLNDWEDVKPAISDEADDSTDNMADIEDIYVYKDKSYLYLALTYNGIISNITFCFDNNGDKIAEYQITYNRSDNTAYVTDKEGKMTDEYIISSNNEVLELRIPLNSIGKPKHFYLQCLISDIQDDSVIDETDDWSYIK